MLELYVIQKNELLLIKPLEERVTIGSGAECTICLRGDLAAMHASIEVIGSNVSVKELEGAVYFNGQRITGMTTLKPNDLFVLGDFRFQINKKKGTECAVTSRTLTCTHGKEINDEFPVITLLKPHKKSFCQLSVIIGRADDCDYRIPDDSLTRKNVSRKHAEIFVKDGKYFVRDLQSKNGTTLYDVNADGRPLPRGGTLCLGRYELPYEIEDTQTVETQTDGIVIPSLNPNLSAKRLIGNSPAMRVLKDKLDRSLPGDHTVLILGENGTGKDLCARYLHFYHPERSKGPFIAVNCAAIPKQLAESHLFGHVKGAFTGAIDDSAGVFQQAHRGTLFLDEIGELPFEIQAQLLRVLEDGIVKPVGSGKDKIVDVRVIFATNRNVDAERSEGKFRNDLYYRCRNVIRVPSLRERKADIELLVDYFLLNSGKPLEVTQDALHTLERYPWPGNVRELSSVVERAIMNASSKGSAVITENDFEIDDDASAYTTLDHRIPSSSMKEQIIQLLKESNGNVKYAALHLKVERKTLYRRMQNFNIDPKTFR